MPCAMHDAVHLAGTGAILLAAVAAQLATGRNSDLSQVAAGGAEFMQEVRRRQRQHRFIRHFMRLRIEEAAAGHHIPASERIAALGAVGAHQHRLALAAMQRLHGWQQVGDEAARCRGRH